MEQVAWILCYFLIGLAIVQLWLVFRFVMALSKWKQPLIDPSDEPRAVVVLCLRGDDPFLDACLAGLLQQDYQNFDVHIVIDHPQDPVVNTVNAAIEGHSNVRVDFLDSSVDTCSLKCSSLVQAIEQSVDSYDFVAQLDADTVPHRTWLRELATALQDEQVGAASGNRWYMPHNPGIGSMIRHIWNAAAVVHMYIYKISWGGTLAIKTSVFKETDMLERWKKAFCEDTMIYSILKSNHQRLAFVPSLMMVNRESCEMVPLFGWVRRQLLNAKLYHPHWWGVIGHGLITSAGTLLVLAVLLTSLLSFNFSAALWLGVGLAVYQALIGSGALLMEFAVRRIVKSRQEPTQWMNFQTAILYLLALPLTQFFYAIILASLYFIRTIHWRGIHYQVGGPWNIKRLEYQPYQSSASNESTSL